MNDAQLRDYLFSDHHKAWPVQRAIKPNIDYQQYVNNLSSQPDEVVVAFGPSAGQSIPRSEARYIRLKPNSHHSEYYYVRKSDVFQINTHRLETNGIPSDYIVCSYNNDYKLYHPKDMVLTDDSNWLPKDICVVLEPDYYENVVEGEPSYIYEGNSVETHDGKIIYRNDSVYCESDDSYYHEDTQELYYSETLNYYIHLDDDNVRYCEDIDEHVLEHHAHWDELAEVYVYDTGNLTSRDHTQSIQDYHCGVEPNFHVQPVDQNNPLSKYTIGFEVEKDCLDDGNQDAGSLIEQQPLFSHWETDSSCGIEGITNVYSLDNAEVFINHVRNSNYTNLETNGRCGGHINFAHRENKLQYWHIRPWLGLIFSMWKKRLNNQYSSCNKKLNPYRGTDHHYGALVEKGRMRNNTRFELRLPNRVKDGDTLIRRFKLMQALIECVDHYINEDFTWMTATYNDDIQGIPNWMYKDADNIEWDIKIRELLENISAPTQARTRFFVEKAKDMLFEGYAEPNHKRVLAYAYAFQSYIDEEQPSQTVTQMTNSYINS